MEKKLLKLGFKKTPDCFKLETNAGTLMVWYDDKVEPFNGILLQTKRSTIIQFDFEQGINDIENIVKVLDLVL